MLIKTAIPERKAVSDPSQSSYQRMGLAPFAQEKSCFVLKNGENRHKADCCDNVMPESFRAAVTTGCFGFFRNDAKGLAPAIREAAEQLKGTAKGCVSERGAECGHRVT